MIVIYLFLAILDKFRENFFLWKIEIVSLCKIRYNVRNIVYCIDIRERKTRELRWTKSG